MQLTSPPVVVRRAQLQARVDRLEGVHGALEHFWSNAEDRGAQPPYNARMQFDLAVIEIAANICEHAAHGGGVTLELELSLYGDRVEARFDDDAGPASLPATSEMPSQAAESGRGLAIVRRIVDELRYERVGEHHNSWFLRKQLQPE
ncbi:MAG: ATP-binding protein [Dehalococcoidia bacterium]|nr:ATP-binding protein [Dehalococcoidia bacterium]HRC61710.1 ATP-binding protein [Dehalococcoidia bacterium]